MNVSLNESQIYNKSFNFLNSISSNVIDSSNSILGNFSSDSLNQLILFLFGLTIIYVGTKVTNKLAKYGMMFVAVLILLSLGLNILS
ncbi:MAG TPA: hypothetical protein VGB37_14650 [Candidatus Lokiarchaeia archaeon]